MLLCIVQHVIFQRWCPVRVHMQADFVAAERIHHTGHLSGPRFPNGCGFFNRFAEAAVVDEMPAPVSRRAHVPAVFQAPIEQEHVA